MRLYCGRIVLHSIPRGKRGSFHHDRCHRHGRRWRWRRRRRRRGRGGRRRERRSRRSRRRRDQRRSRTARDGAEAPEARGRRARADTRDVAEGIAEGIVAVLVAIVLVAVVVRSERVVAAELRFIAPFADGAGVLAPSPLVRAVGERRGGRGCERRGRGTRVTRVLVRVRVEPLEAGAGGGGWRVEGDRRRDRRRWISAEPALVREWIRNVAEGIRNVAAGRRISERVVARGTRTGGG